MATEEVKVEKLKEQIALGIQRRAQLVAEQELLTETLKDQAKEIELETQLLEIKKQ